MILLSTIIDTFESEYLIQYQQTMLPSHRKALAAMKHCRTTSSPVMQAQCAQCNHQVFVPHSCGHRNCPHCQHHESEQWLERQLQKQVPAEYFLLTFTLPKEFRELAWQHQRILYDLMIRCSWACVNTFAHNDISLQGTPGAISVLHTHSRTLDYHPHVHMVVPAAVIDEDKKWWRTKKQQKNQTKYLFNHKALAKVFRAKMLEAITQSGLKLPLTYPRKWIVNVKSVGSGDKALVYLGRYLYKGVIQEKDIIACNDGMVTFRYRESDTNEVKYRTLSGIKFLRLILQHVLPKGFRRTRNFGFLHPNSKRLIALLQYLLGFNQKRVLALIKKRPPLICACCGAEMNIVRTLIPPLLPAGFIALAKTLMR